MKIFINLLAFLITLNLTYSEVPNFFNYQGILKDNYGKEINGVKLIQFNLYENESANNPIWQETQQVVFNNGYFNVYLNIINKSENLFNKPLWLGISLDNGNSELKPRIMLSSVPYSIRSAISEGLEKDVAVTSINGLKNDIKILGKDNISVETQNNQIQIKMNDKNTSNFNYIIAGVVDSKGELLNSSEKINFSFDKKVFRISKSNDYFDFTNTVISITPIMNDGYVNSWIGNSDPDLMLNLSKNPMNYTIYFENGELVISWKYKKFEELNNYWNIPFQFVIYKLANQDK